MEDALFSAKSMALMFGNGEVDQTSNTNLLKTFEWTAESAAQSAPSKFEVNGKTYSITNATIYDATGSSVASSAVTEGTKYYVTGLVGATSRGTIEISANSFPGTYYVTGDTYARSAITGEDEFFQFIIHKAKVNAENTITLEAEGDPSVFNLSLRVLRPADATEPMMELVKYDMTVSV